MEQSQYLIDTNAVIDYLGQKIPASGMAFMNNVINAVPRLSVVTKIEVLGFNAPPEHYLLLTNFMNDAAIMSLSEDIVNESISIRKKHKTKLPDAIIAATAIVTKSILISRNISDFRNIEGLTVIDAHLI
ncbi:type II toxin-antitoxin system VapC family toxin [Mucilaginibacter psychrotolerans]|uniref:Type II toxin-antitoxin system VapC family toxin n=1 Tax=Mucilaginibacter psychrotolerans TaxID=1524096 RepID=A0A4Y8S8L9_9SPHI|nr:type II toxin-antitoxin system VapC family toxin [Mucilaginibacter psychrotolerans]TFF34975.1 type II toxin-antitoxin system VapC family toxin [Mucilaginibacter psychrotolerans]